LGEPGFRAYAPPPLVPSLGLGVEAEGEGTKAAKARKRAGLSGGLPGHKWVETSSKAG